jgi:cobalamin synthase
MSHRTNRIYLGLVTGLCLVYLLAAVLLPHVHVLATRRVIAYSYAISKFTILPVLYLWLVLDDDKSLPWRDRGPVRHGIAAILLAATALYIRGTRSVDIRWAEIAFWGAVLSACLSGLIVARYSLQRLRGENRS